MQVWPWARGAGAGRGRAPPHGPRCTLSPGFPYEKVVQRVLYLQVLDYDRFSRNDPIGEVSIPLNKVDLTQMQTFWKDLKPCSDGSVRPGPGEGTGGSGVLWVGCWWMAFLRLAPCPAHLPCPPGEPRGAAPVALLQPLCQLHHREHHQSPEPQSHGHRGHIRCGPPAAWTGGGGGVNPGRLGDTGSCPGWTAGSTLFPSLPPLPHLQSPFLCPRALGTAASVLSDCPSQEHEAGSLRGAWLGPCSHTAPGGLGFPASPGSVSASVCAGGQRGGRVPPSSSSVQRSPTPLAGGFPDSLTRCCLWGETG